MDNLHRSALIVHNLSASCGSVAYRLARFSRLSLHQHKTLPQNVSIIGRNFHQKSQQFTITQQIYMNVGITKLTLAAKRRLYRYATALSFCLLTLNMLISREQQPLRCWVTRTTGVVDVSSSVKTSSPVKFLL